METQGAGVGCGDGVVEEEVGHCAGAVEGERVLAVEDGEGFVADS